ncbi:hypothetical protein D3C87_2058070 [compost metagenome]
MVVVLSHVRDASRVIEDAVISPFTDVEGLTVTRIDQPVDVVAQTLTYFFGKS